MLLEKNKKKRPTLKEFNEKYRIPDGCSAEIQDDAFTVKSLLTDIQLAMEIFFVANVTREKIA
ncbi:MAG: hypothetical protein K2K28_00420 [Clostridia bacterium]|nr:hypothetical protein [Clostridia bacterium]